MHKTWHIFCRMASSVSNLAYIYLINHLRGVLNEKMCRPRSEFCGSALFANTLFTFSRVMIIKVFFAKGNNF